MRKTKKAAMTFLAVLFWSGLSVPAVQSVEPQTPAIIIEPESKLWLVGDSTLHPYSSHATEMSGLITASDIPAGTALETAVKGNRIKSFVLTIPIEGLKSGESGLDKNMYAALDAEKNPVISFKLVDYKTDVDSTTPSSLIITADGALTINGVSRDIQIQSKALPAAGRIRLTGSKSLKMTDFGVQPPRLMMGMLKVKDDLTIRFDLFMGFKEMDKNKIKEK